MLRVFGAMLLLLSAACAPRELPLVGRAFGECRDVREYRPVTGPKGQTPHPDYARLRAYRHYFSLQDVRPFAHHFAVYFTCIEQSVEYYGVREDGSVVSEGGAFGGLAYPPPHHPVEIPDDQRAHADAVLAAFHRDYEGESGGRIVYLGSHREVVVRELMPWSPPGDPLERISVVSTVTLAASADLTELFERPFAGEGGISKLCWPDDFSGDCTEPRWIDFEIEGPDANGLLFTRAGTAVHPQAKNPWGAFPQAVLAAARNFEHGTPGVPLDTLLARQHDGVLPPSFVPDLGLRVSLFARPHDTITTQQVSEELWMPLDVQRARPSSSAASSSRASR